MKEDYYDAGGRIIDYYTLFNLPYNAKNKEIKTAFHCLVKRYHPDTAAESKNTSTEKMDSIIRGYRILADDRVREEYNKHLFKIIKPAKNEYLILPNKRVRYSVSLANMLKSRFKPGIMKRKDILFNFGQDIEIIVTRLEAMKGAIAYIELPSRMNCPLCSGQNPECYVCRGIGRIHTSSQLEVKISPKIESGTMIDVDLKKMKPDSLTRFHSGSIRIKITVTDQYSSS